MSVGLLLEMAAESHPRREALRSLDGTSLTTAGYRDRVAAAAGLVRECGASRVVLLGEATAAFPVAFFAAAWAGVPFTPVNHRLPAERVRELLERLPGAMVIADEPGRVNPAELFADRAPVEPAVPDPGAVAVELFTSGTTGSPRLAELSHENLFGYVTETVELGAAGADEALVLATPPFHIAAVAAVLTSIYAGRRLVPLGRFTPERWLSVTAAEHATHAFLVPTMVARVLDTLDADPGLAAPRLRSLSYGGARMPRPVLQRALAAFGDTDFVNAYGLTETSSTVAVLGPAEHRAAAAGDPVALERLGSVGKVLPGVEVRIVDENGTALPVGAQGAVELRGRQVSGTGWLRTGDTGRLDPDGYLFLGGRTDDVIIKGGENIAPGEIEDVLLGHPDVAAAAAVGLPDPDWGERIGAAVVVRRPVAPDALRAWARDRVGSLKTPDVVRVVGALPETPTGKIIRSGVRDLLGTAEATR